MSESYALKHKRSTRGLDTIQAVYAFVMALGLREVFVGSHDFITKVIFGTANKESITFVASLLLLANVVLLGIRFFWVPRNLRRIIYIGALFNKNEPKLSMLGSAYLSINWLIILFHGGLYFTLCTEFKYIMFSLASNAVPQPSIFIGYFFGHAFLLIINGLWIAALAWHERQLGASVGLPEEQHVHGGLIWFRNNLAFSLLALAPLALIGTCQSAPFSCVERFGIASSGYESAIATSGVIIASLVSLVAPVFSLFGFDTAYDVTLWVLLCFLFNSLLDLLTTGSDYIVLEEVEWEAKT